MQQIMIIIMKEIKIYIKISIDQYEIHLNKNY